MISLYSMEVEMAFSLRAHARLATPPMTSQGMADFKISSMRVDPSKTQPYPPLMDFPIPTPPPLCRAIKLIPRAAFPAKIWVAWSAIILDPSLMLEVSLKGLSVPPVSWWSRPSMMGPISPRRTMSLNLRAISRLPRASE